MGLVIDATVAADEHGKQVVHSHEFETPARKPVRLARDESHGVTGLGQSAQRGNDAIVCADEPVVVGELVLAVAAEEPLCLGFIVVRVFPQDRLERAADGGAPLGIGGCLADKADEGVASGREDELD